MKLRLSILCFLWGTCVGLSQRETSKGDNYFYAYAYNDAIEAYQKQMKQGKLISNAQRLNLADAYFQTGEYLKASKIYIEVNRNDSIMTDNRFNKMLQSLSKSSEFEKIDELLLANKNKLAGQLLENAEFNKQVLKSETGETSGFFTFSLNSNSPQDDNAPSFYKDDLLFSSSRNIRSNKVYGPTGESYLDIYQTSKAQNGGFSQVEPFKRIPVSAFHKSTPFFDAATGNLYYVLSNTEDKKLAFDENGKNALAVGMSTEGGNFRFLLKDLSTSFYYPFYDNAANRLYFSANFDDSYGGTDIYYVDTNNGQVMSQPVNLGPRINTPGNEIAPYVFDNSLFFSSDVFYGLGGMDVYRSNLLPDQGFSIPVNLGKGINTKYDEFGFIIRPNKEDGVLGYFASNRPGGKGGDDVYGFKISEKPGLETLLFRGVVVQPPYDKTLPKASVKILDANNNVLKEVFSNAFGRFQIEIPYEAVVTLQVSKESYSRYVNTFNPKSLKELQQKPLTIELAAISDITKEEEGKIVLDIKDFIFASGQSRLSAAIIAELNQVVAVVQKFPAIQFSIETHTDSRGSRSSNQRISERRSLAIKNYLTQNGVPQSAILSAKGYGEDRLVNDCSDGVYCLDFLHQKTAELYL